MGVPGVFWNMAMPMGQPQCTGIMGKRSLGDFQQWARKTMNRTSFLFSAGEQKWKP